MIKRGMNFYGTMEVIPVYQKEALEMIASKIARALSGDSNHLDNWVDIAGYAQLVVQKLEKETDEKDN